MTTPDYPSVVYANGMLGMVTGTEMRPQGEVVFVRLLGHSESHAYSPEQIRSAMPEMPDGDA